MIMKLKRNSPAQRDLRQMATDSKSLCHEILAKVKNSRQRRLKIRRLKYTCQAMIPVGAGDWEEERKSVGFDNKEEEVHESMKISLSLMSTEEEEEDRSLVRNDAVLAVYDGDECEDNGDVEQLSYGSVSLIGSRKEMEDAVSIKMGLVMKERVKCDFFAVYDGHGGPQVAKACRERLHRLLAEEVKRHKRTGDKVDWEGMMEVCFAKMDGEVADNAAVRTVGSTALVMVVAKDQIVVANCGDCRAVMARGGEAFALSNDHKPDRPDELMRIEAAGGRVINWNGQRVLGVLATSRSIGDQYLRPYVISKPEVTVTKRTDKDEFLVLGSDGLWDVISNEAACQVVRKYLSSQITKVSPGVSYQSRAAEAAALLAELAMTKGSRDNTSVIVVELRNRNI